jgi:hypothetical protein
VLSLSNNSSVRFYQPFNSGLIWKNNYNDGMGVIIQYASVFGVNTLWQTNQFSPIVGGAWTLGTAASSGVPEIDPAAGSSALSLVAGMLAMIEQRRRRAALVA